MVCHAFQRKTDQTKLKLTCCHSAYSLGVWYEQCRKLFGNNTSGVLLLVRHGVLRCPTLKCKISLSVQVLLVIHLINFYQGLIFPSSSTLLKVLQKDTFPCFSCFGCIILWCTFYLQRKCWEVKHRQSMIWRTNTDCTSPLYHCHHHYKRFFRFYGLLAKIKNFKGMLPSY